MAETEEGALVEAARAGDQHAFGQLFDRWFDRVHDLTRRIVRDPGIASEVSQDAFLAAWTRLDSLEDPDAFGGWLLRISRNGALNRLAKERRATPTDQETLAVIRDSAAEAPDPLARLDQAARIDLVWDASRALGERDVSVLDLHLRHGLGASELADELGVTANNAHQVLFTLRKRLATAVRAFVLWRGGRPACDTLRSALTDSGHKGFDAGAMKLIDRHARDCPSCSAEREDRLAPAALFSAAPIVAAPFAFKATAASALAAEGVPMAGSAALTTPVAPVARETSDRTGRTDRAGPPETGGDGIRDGGDRPMPTPAPTGPGSGLRRRRGAVLMVSAVLVVAVVMTVAAVVFLGGGSGDPDQQLALLPVTADGTTTTTVPPEVLGPSSPSTAPTGTGPSSPAVEFDISTEAPSDPDPRRTDPTVAPSPPATDPTTAPRTPPSATPTTPGTPTTPSSPTTTTSTTTTTTPPTPVIASFDLTTVEFQCQGGLIWTATWISDHATSAVITHEGVTTTVPVNGSQQLCLAEAWPQVTLTVTGPGGTAAATRP